MKKTQCELWKKRRTVASCESKQKRNNMQKQMESLTDETSVAPLTLLSTLSDPRSSSEIIKSHNKTMSNETGMQTASTSSTTDTDVRQDDITYLTNLASTLLISLNPKSAAKNTKRDVNHDRHLFTNNKGRDNRIMSVNGRQNVQVSVQVCRYMCISICFLLFIILSVSREDL